MSGGIVVRPWTDGDRAWVAGQARRLFGGETVVSRGRVHRPLELPGWVALLDGERAGVATYRVDDASCELVTIDSLAPRRGAGTALLEAVERAAAEAGCTRLWLITTNDNLDALRFYQRRGYAIAAVHPGAIERSRELKPSIPHVGRYHIPLRDEIELHKRLG